MHIFSFSRCNSPWPLVLRKAHYHINKKSAAGALTLHFLFYMVNSSKILSRFSSEYSISEEYILAYSIIVSRSPSLPWVRQRAAIILQLNTAKEALETMSPSSRAEKKWR